MRSSHHLASVAPADRWSKVSRSAGTRPLRPRVPSRMRSQSSALKTSRCSSRVWSPVEARAVADSTRVLSRLPRKRVKPHGDFRTLTFLASVSLLRHCPSRDPSNHLRTAPSIRWGTPADRQGVRVQPEHGEAVRGGARLDALRATGARCQASRSGRLAREALVPARRRRGCGAPGSRAGVVDQRQPADGGAGGGPVPAAACATTTVLGHSVQAHSGTTATRASKSSFS